MSKAAWVRWFLSLVALVGLLSVSAAKAADSPDELEKLDASLKLIPADASFYSSMLRNREQVEMFLQSKAFAKLKALPFVRMGLKSLQEQSAEPRSEVAQMRMALENPEIAKLVNLAGDMFSNEVFVYGDSSATHFLELLVEINGSQNYESLMYKIHGFQNGKNEWQAQLEAMSAALTANLDSLAVPNLVAGFKLEKPDAANEALAKLEALLHAALPMVDPRLKDALKREKIGGHEFLVLRLDGEMIPWRGDEAEKLQQQGINEEEASNLIDHLKEMKLVVALGVRENYLLASIGSSVDCLEKLGVGDRLIDLPQLAPLAKFADRKLVGISYLSGDLYQAFNSQGKSLDQLYAAFEQFLSRSDLDEERVERILGDVQMFVEDCKAMIAEPSEVLSFGFLADRGIESYCYRRGNDPRIDGSKPLGLLEHAGGNPLLGVVDRGRVDVADYDKLVKWLSIGWKYFNEFAVPAMEEPDRRKFMLYAEDVLPLLERLDKANRDSLIPALADGQSSLVIDGKFTSKRLHAKLPEYEKAMPLPEIGLAMGVTDAKRLKEGASEYFAVAREIVEVIRKYDPTALPPGFELSPPKVTQSADNAIYSYPLPPEWEVDENLVPNAGLSENVAVLSLSLDHTGRMLKKTPLTTGGVLVKTDKKLAAAAWFNLVDLLDASRPWIDYCFQRVDESQLGGDRAAVVGQVHAVLDVLKCYQGVTAECYLEDDYLVTHSLAEIHDVKE
jgi:hypothetical protein